MKIAASDFDGTLYRNGTVTEEEKNAIARWRKNGNLFGIITGRSYGFIKEDVDRFRPEYDFIISTNGAVIRDGEGKVLAEHRAEHTHAKEILDMAVAHNAMYFEIMYLDSNHRRVVDFRSENDPLVIREEVLYEADYFHQLSCTIPKIEAAMALTDEINEKFGETLTAYCLVDPAGNKANIDVVKKGVSKASALYTLAQLKNVAKENMITVGDNYNDIPMVREFDGYVMASAFEGVRALANRTCETLCDILL